MTGIEKAITACGSQAKLAELIGCTQQNVSFWRRQGFVPPDRILEIEQASGVGRTELINPKLLDLFAPI
ncbi:Putative bacterial antitoxin YdaS [uncultured Caudovirales phage]|uniref:Bacterial antitoxin YdaS n=1 Tax=uncultured Caudovirales phage TaxID=2100421 RepID=A0A6J7WUN7_9CAUD|nr:Putative bacterial antitoxin YdaS [uncultured Caudovirales phage]CAB4124899.1 Putative bacterial antitoxin YdaS [uncultured Caudovirales phage]CAB5219804.1 Putative bacterial antitoxin YdaS [uncultured Caudovirales phage]